MLYVSTNEEIVMADRRTVIAHQIWRNENVKNYRLVNVCIYTLRFLRGKLILWLIKPTDKLKYIYFPINTIDN